jgi:hypothetical protein
MLNGKKAQGKKLVNETCGVKGSAVTGFGTREAGYGKG